MTGSPDDFAEVRDAGGTLRVLNPPFRMSAATAPVSPLSASPQRS
jgi:hypothetical protein